MYAGLAQAQTPPPAPGFLTQLVQGFLATPQGQAVQQDVAGAVSPFLIPAGQQAAGTWLSQNKTTLLVGGAVAAGLIVWLARR